MKQDRFPAVLVLLVFVIALSPSHGWAATYYVRADGNDACTGTADSSGSSGSCAKRSIQAAVNLAYAGDTVLVHAGDYSNITPSFTTVRAGASGSPITIRAASGETVRVSKFELVHGYNVGQGFEVVSAGGQSWGPGIWIRGNNVTAQSNTIKGTGVGNTGISFDGWHENVRILNNRIEGSNTAGTSFEVAIRVVGGNVLVEGNTIRNFNGIERGFELYGSGITVRSNVCSNWNMTLSYDDSHPDIFQVFGSSESRDVLIERNLFYNLDAQIGNVSTSGGTKHWTFRNNIFANITQPMFNWVSMDWYNNLFYHCATSNNSSHVVMSGGYGGTNEVYNNAFVGTGYEDADNRGWMDAVTGQGNNFVSKLNGSAKGEFDWGGSNINGGTAGFISANSNCVSSLCNFQLSANSNLINRGTTLSSFSNDFAGASRPQGGSWDIGPYEYGGTVVQLFCGDGTCNNGETCDSCDEDCDCGCVPDWQCSAWSQCVNDQQTRTCVDANGCGITSGKPATTQLCGNMIQAESGAMVFPMTQQNDPEVSGGAYIESTVEDSGTATYVFNIVTPGTYKFTARVFAESDANDSFFFKLDNNAEDVWDLNPASVPEQYNAWEDVDINRRGSGTYDAPEYAPYEVALTAGPHTLVLRGREASTKLDYFQPIQVGGAMGKRGDLNSDGRVDIVDFGVLLSNWGKTTKPPSDLNQDGAVDIVDLGIMLSDWG